LARAGARDESHILLTHLHLDHIMGLLFFAPLFDPQSRVTVWGPPDPSVGLRRRLARYLSAPLSPIEIRELPAQMEFRMVPSESFRLGSAEIEAALVNHRGPTLGYRVTDGDAVLAYIPDHEPALGQNLERDAPEWISGWALACTASLLIHDAQYTAEEYEGTRGWGHSTVHDALAFPRRACSRSRSPLPCSPLPRPRARRRSSCPTARRVPSPTSRGWTARWCRRPPARSRCTWRRARTSGTAAWPAPTRPSTRSTSARAAAAARSSCTSSGTSSTPR